MNETHSTITELNMIVKSGRKPTYYIGREVGEVVLLMFLRCLDDFLYVLYLVAVVVQSLSRIRLFETPWTAARQAPLSFAIS